MVHERVTVNCSRDSLAMLTCGELSSHSCNRLWSPVSSSNMIQWKADASSKRVRWGNGPSRVIAQEAASVLKQLVCAQQCVQMNTDCTQEKCGVQGVICTTCKSKHVWRPITCMETLTAHYRGLCEKNACAALSLSSTMLHMGSARRSRFSGGPSGTLLECWALDSPLRQ